MNRKIRIYCEKRSTPLKVIPINFPPLLNLRLDLLEDKSKLKKSLPLIPLANKKTPNRSPLYPIMLETGAFVLTKPADDQPLTPPDEEKQSTEPTPEVVDTTSDNVIPMSDEDKTIFHLLGDTPSSKPPPPSLSPSPPISPVPSPSILPTSQDEPVHQEEKEEKEEKEEEEEDPYAGLTPEEREIKEREEYTWRFRILRKQYKKTLNIPQFTEYTPLETIKLQYNQIVREMALDDNVDTYRTYLFGSWLAIEFVCTQWIGVDLSGFTKYQALMLHKYDKLLIELGEKSRGAWGANLPVEVRLIGLVLFQAGVFYLIKIVAGKFGCSVADLFSIFMGQPPSSSDKSSDKSTDGNNGGFGSMLGDLMSSFTGGGGEAENTFSSPPPSPTKMRGPSIRAEDIRSRRTQKN